MEKIDIVCPVKDQDWGRFEILHKSIVKHTKIDYNLIVISPSGKCPISDKKILSYKDNDIIPIISKNCFKNTGWWKQQALKLAAHTLFETEAVLVLDADCFMVKDMYYEDIVTNNKINIKISPGGSWDNWYYGSSQILKLNFDHKKNRIGVTPVILSTKIVKSLVSYLKALYNNDPWHYLLSNTTVYSPSFNPPTSPTWTEYCLYHIYGMNSNLWHEHHNNTNIELSGNCFWDAKGAESWDPKKSFDNPYFYFTVAQSISGKSAEWVKDKIKPFL
jgi:hypothetical protein